MGEPPAGFRGTPRRQTRGQNLWKELRMKKAFLTSDQRKPWSGAARRAMAQGNWDPLTEAAEKW